MINNFASSKSEVPSRQDEQEMLNELQLLQAREGEL
jgi:hypothetical protein